MTAVAFFALGVVISLAGRLIAVWIRKWRESTAREGQNRKRQERDEITEPTLAELLAETGWRINPNESDRELARKAIPMVLLCAIALLFLLARSGVGWALFRVHRWPTPSVHPTDAIGLKRAYCAL